MLQVVAVVLQAIIVWWTATTIITIIEQVVVQAIIITITTTVQPIVIAILILTTIYYSFQSFLGLGLTPLQHRYYYQYFLIIITTKFMAIVRFETIEAQIISVVIAITIINLDRKIMSVIAQITTTIEQCYLAAAVFGKHSIYIDKLMNKII